MKPVWLFVHPKDGPLVFWDDNRRASVTGSVPPWMDLRGYRTSATAFASAGAARRAIAACFALLEEEKRGEHSTWAEERFKWLGDVRLMRIEVAT